MENLKEVSIGLIVWLVFLLSFILLGYPILISIFLGALGGLSGGWIVAWWNDDTPPPESSHQEEEEINYPKRKSHGPGIVAAQQQRRIRERHTPRGRVVLPLPWRFGRRRGNRR
ncbi:hypothetical protein PN462_08290 [Spirulina sp. CS-785/01]|nr:hypothetical protein [Spirulina sp. CS-785/01]